MLYKNLLVVCVDRDDDLGRKAKVVGPVIGREENIEAAKKLALADPKDSDVNCIFAAVKKYDELKKKGYNVEVVTLTGHDKFSFESDKRLNEQLDAVLEKFDADGFVLVTDGAEDDQILPILQSRRKVISKETVIVKQAKEVESTFYTIKEALKDPFLARIVFGIPGIILLLMFALPTIGLQLIMFIAGVYLLMKGFGIEEILLDTTNQIITSISTQRTSFPFYIATILILIFGLVSGYNAYLKVSNETLAMQVISVAHPILFFIVIAAISFYIGRTLDAFQFRKAFYIKNYFRSVISVILIWFILDSAKLVFVGKADFSIFLFIILICAALFYLSFRFSRVFDVRLKPTKLWIGLNVFDDKGINLGKIVEINPKKKLMVLAYKGKNKKVNWKNAIFQKDYVKVFVR